MEDTPKIIMQCPKCSREYSPDTSYCDACSAMLEPIEINAPGSQAATEAQKAPDIKILGEKGEVLDDIKIDSLKSEIELTFTRTLLLELTQLKKRLPVNNDNSTRTGTGDDAFQPGIGGAVSGDEDVEKRIAKLEAILFNLHKKIDADISNLQTRLDGLKRPGLTALMTDKGRIYRMLSSELKTKYTVLNSIQTRVPASAFRRFRPSLVTVIAIIALVTVAWTMFTAVQETRTGPAATVLAPQTYGAEGKVIVKSDITGLLEDIKTANLREDLALWASRYSKSYLAIEGKKENILALWKNFDYISLAYRIDKINVRPETTSAQITWDMELRSGKTGRIVRKTQTLSADFVREDKKFKISAVRNKAL